jgi:hypothetical protein
MQLVNLTSEGDGSKVGWTDAWFGGWARIARAPHSRHVLGFPFQGWARSRAVGVACGAAHRRPPRTR